MTTSKTLRFAAFAILAASAILAYEWDRASIVALYLYVLALHLDVWELQR
jgi:hypothetical protein